MLDALTRRYCRLAAIGLLAGLAGAVQAAEITLFQPGQSAWEWLLVPSKHDGGKRMREGKSCLFCHEGEQQVIGNAMAAGHDIEPEPIAGMPGFIDMSVSASYDADNLYVSACWGPLPAGTWGQEGAEQMFTIAIGTADLNVAPIAGCWSACHRDLPGMQDVASGPRLTKYLPGSRSKMTASGGGHDVRPAAELDAQLAEGKYLEYWQLELSEGQVTDASDGYFLDARVSNQDAVVSGSGEAGGPGCSLQLVRPLAPTGKARHALTEGEGEVTPRPVAAAIG
jgi:cytochrome c-type protein NapC